jgi:chromosome segregation ATPase
MFIKISLDGARNEGALELLRALREVLPLPIEPWLARLQRSECLTDVAADLAFAVQRQRQIAAHEVAQLKNEVFHLNHQHETILKQLADEKTERERYQYLHHRATTENRQLQERLSPLESEKQKLNSALTQTRYNLEVAEDTIADLRDVVAKLQLEALEANVQER